MSGRATETNAPPRADAKTGPGRLLLYEDEHLLVVNKPAGLNTHGPAPFAGEGLFDWLRDREPRWATLAIIHRLDKETSGILVFAKTPIANRSLTEQFTQHSVHKEYVLLTDRPLERECFEVTSCIVRVGEKYVSRPLRPGGERAETRFRVENRQANQTSIRAEPVTGRTHQIRVHAAEQGFPILGDVSYGGTAWPRLCLHAAVLTFRHPVTGASVTFRADPDFAADARAGLRDSLVDQSESTAFRLVHGGGDGQPGWYVDRLGDYLLSQSHHPLTKVQQGWLETFPRSTGVYHQLLNRSPRGATPEQLSPRLVLGERAQTPFVISENAVRFELSLQSLSVGLFLDQRENRRRFLRRQVARDFPLYTDGAAGCQVLNTFAYTCGFSVCAALGGARTTSLDLSRTYLEWGKRNFRLNQLDPADHEFLHGDVFEWLKRLGKKERRFDVIVLDPPTFSRSKSHGVFQAEKDYGKLAAAALPLLKPAGVLFASTNAASWRPEDFLATLERTIASVGRRTTARHYVPQPPDFPIHPSEPAYLKTVWLRVDAD